MALIVTNVAWLALEWFYLDTTSHTQFSLIRLAYFSFVGIIRAESSIEYDNTDFDREEVIISKEAIKTAKVWLYDVASWCFIIWTFGRSIM